MCTIDIININITTRLIPTKFGITIKTTNYASWVVQAGVEQIQDDGRSPSLKIEKRSYLGNGWPTGTKFDVLTHIDRMNRIDS